ncbi:MAG: N-acetylmuramoyl-L-alanine amidase [Desulfosporosinus sp.]|nr:N-acetylmuramoyl-L-alanine amidase [Desulfosporosinus sp.]
MNKPNITWIGSPNFSSPKGYKIIAIVNHIMSGTLTGTDAWFAKPTSKVSSHFGVGKNGEIHQYVNLANPAWANGVINKPNWALLQSGVNPNYYTVSIEHEGESGDVMPEVQYQSTLALHQWLIRTLNIPVTCDNIIGHYRIDSVNKAKCPGTGFPWDRLFQDLQGGSDVLM